MLSFPEHQSPIHRGYETNGVILALLRDFPSMKPLILVLKKFLNDRSLLLSYSGGLSSYALR